MRPTAKPNATTTESAPLIVLGYDENHKPRAARFPATEAELVAKAAELMDLKVYEAASEDLAALAKKLPEGRLYGNGRGFVPNVRQSLYSEIIVTLAVEPQAAVGKDQDEPTGSATPVMKFASSDARNNAAFATSQGVPILWRSGTRASRAAATSARLLPLTRARVSTAIGVSINPGRMTLARTPNSAFWMATC
jgi:hypothetical protein